MQRPGDLRGSEEELVRLEPEGLERAGCSEVLLVKSQTDPVPLKEGVSLPHKSSGEHRCTWSRKHYL